MRHHVQGWALPFQTLQFRDLSLRKTPEYEGPKYSLRQRVLPAFLFAALLFAFGLSLSLSLAPPANAFTKQKVTVIGVPEDAERIGKTRCVFAGVCASKKTGLYSYDPGIWGMAKFHNGEVVLRDGTKLDGRVAVLNLARDWSFVKRVVLVIPTGEADAIYIGAQDAALITQQHKKGERVFDPYDGAYLQRLVSGKMRLSYNPAAGTSRPLSDFLPAGTISSLSGALGRQGVIDALKDGRTVSESLTKGTSAGRALGDALASVEITEKEYLLYNEKADILTPITKANYRSNMEKLFANCPAADTKQTKKLAKKYKKIEEAISYYNGVCG
jgi:hypothetical protein